MKIMHVLFHTALLLRRIEYYQKLCFLDIEKRPKAMELLFWRKVVIFVDDDFILQNF